MRKQPKFLPRICSMCGSEYTPSGPVSKFCKECSIKADKARKLKWQEQHSKPPAVRYETCSLCGLPFYSCFDGIPCCCHHYNIAYRHGSPTAKHGRKSTTSFRCKGEFVVCTTSRGVEFLIDNDDLEAVQKHSWCISKTGYAVANINYKVTKLHRWLLSPTSTDIIDHINGNILDNRRINLRIATPAGNAQNSRSKNNKDYSGIRLTKHGTYNARITISRKSIHIGNFKTLDEAINARRIAEEKYFGEFAPTRP